MRTTLLIFALSLSSCATPLKPEAATVQLVRRVSPDCTHLGRIEARDIWSGDFETVKNKLKNQTVDLGGNTIVIDHVNGNGQKPTVADAWKCP